MGPIDLRLKVIDAFTTDGFLERTVDVYEYGMIPARSVLRS